MRKILFPISILYWIALTIRHKLYDWNILRTHRFSAPVICLGNLRLGGTGKTPHTDYLIGILKAEYRVAVLSRGYGRKTKGFVAADNASSHETIGDEPLLYYKKHPDIQVCVDEDRAEGVGRMLGQTLPPQVILLDDAFQHRKIAAGLNLLLTEYDSLYTEDHLVPMGNLRDIRSAARRADYIIVSKSPQTLDSQTQEKVRKRLRASQHQELFFSSIEYDALQALNARAEACHVDEADSVLVFCGIANPTPLVEHLKTSHQNVELMRFADHHTFSKSDIRGILKRFGEMEGNKKIVVTTGKDAMRWEKSAYLWQFETVPLFSAPIHIRFHQEEKFNEAIKHYVRQNLKHR